MAVDLARFAPAAQESLDLDEPASHVRLGQPFQSALELRFQGPDGVAQMHEERPAEDDVETGLEDVRNGAARGHGSVALL